MKNVYKILGLTRTEVKVLELLETGKNISEINVATKIPRSTILDILTRLKDKTLIFRQGKKYTQNLEVINEIGGKELSIGEVSRVVVHKGFDELFAAWRKVYKYKVYRCYSYQSNYSVKNFFKNVNLIELFKHNKKVSEDKQILEFFVEPGFLQNVKNILDKDKYKEWLVSFRRNFVAYEVQKDVFYSESDIIVFEDTLFFTNYKNQTCIEIKQYDTVQTVKNLLSSLKNASNYINLNKIIDEEIQRL